MVNFKWTQNALLNIDAKMDDFNNLNVSIFTLRDVTFQGFSWNPDLHQHPSADRGSILTHLWTSIFMYLFQSTST